MATEFLPLCDNLFNVISLAGYFCDVVFDIVLGYALLERGKINYFVAVIVIITFSLVISQIVSLRWYINNKKLKKAMASVNQEVAEQSTAPIAKISKYSVIGLHCSLMGVLWRYAKLFVPVDLRYVKHEVRDLCILRLIHAFCEAAPMLLIQSYILITLRTSSLSENLNTIKIKTLGGQVSTHLVHQSAVLQQYQQKTFKKLNTISAILSLFSICWALASFSKNVRIHNVHRLVLTWLGVIFQFFWRLGTVTARVISLTVYASVYGHWIFLVLTLHWISMFLWLISPKNAFHGERISRMKKLFFSGLLGFVYIFAYINFQEVNHRQKMTTFYIVMFLENCLLVSLWMFGVWHNKSDDWYLIPLLVLGCFLGGMFLMFLYYRYFHIRRLGYDTESEMGRKFNKTVPYPHVCGNSCSPNDSKYPNMFPENHVTYHQKKERGSYDNPNACVIETEIENEDKFKNAATNEHLKGIFNCRFTNPNNATKRKKKKPTTFVPPPVLGLTNIPGMGNNVNTNSLEKAHAPQPLTSTPTSNGPMSIPFWRRPLPRHQGGSSENEGSVGSSKVDIKLKLKEKKQKQLAELKIIEEEIKQGKLKRPNKLGVTETYNEDGKMSLLPKQPIPRTKKHIEIDSFDISRISSSSEMECRNVNIMMHHPQQSQHSKNDSSNIMYNNFSNNNGGIAAALTKFSHEILNNISIGGDNTKTKQPSTSSTMTSTTSENENSSLTRQMVSSRKKLLHHNINMNPRQVTPSPNCHPRQLSGAYSSLESKTKTDTNRSTNSKNSKDSLNKNSLRSNSNSNSNKSNSIDKETSLASQLIKRQMKRANTPEILLAPNHLDPNPHYYMDRVNGGPSMNGAPNIPNGYLRTNGDYHNAQMNGHGYDRSIDMNDCDGKMVDDSHDVPSDIDSQMSLPRSYTLPREFKFNRKNDGRKIIKNEAFVASTNSSDGDVDSCDDNEFEDDDDEHLRKGPMNQRNIRNFNRRTNNLNKSNYINRNTMHPNNNNSNNSNNNAYNNLSTNNLDQNIPGNPKHYPPRHLNTYNLRAHMNNNTNNNCTNNGNIKVNNLDLITDCMDDGNYDIEGHTVTHNGHIINNRQMRRIYGNSPFNRHETKL